MRQLPAPRVSLNPAFQVTGLDFAGPFLMKKGHSRKPIVIEMYLCVFVCFSTKAAHNEIVSDLTTEAFIACLKRFVVRRGLPAVIYIDNGSNYRGARNDLYELYQFLQRDVTQKKVITYLLSQRIEWRFSPERAHPFGGLWEASLKNTVTAQVEACLDSRPLLQLSSHSDDAIFALTTGHFLIGKPLKAYPETTIKTSTHLLRRWNLCHSLVQYF